MASILTYEFEELPLVLENGIQAGLVDGEAEIAYGRDVWDFTIRSISLTAWSKAGRMKKCMPLDEGNPLYNIIYDRLEGHLNDSVQDAIREQLAEDRNEAAEMRAEARRDDRMMEGRA